MNRFTYWIAPLIIATYPTLVIYNHNIDQVELIRVVLPLIYSLMFTVVCGFISYLVYKDSLKASTFTSLLVLLFFSYGYIYLKLGDEPQTKNLPISLNLFLIGIYAIILIAASVALFVWKKPSPKVNTAIILFAMTLFIINVITIIPFELNHQISSHRLKQHQHPTLPFNSSDSFTSSQIPDVYYIVFDRYASQEVLDHYFNFDNSSIYNTLNDSGFFVSHSSKANYPNTFLALASSLNIDYLNYLTNTLGVDQQNRVSVYQNLIQSNHLANFFKSIGYKYVLVGDFWDPTKTSHIADENYNLFQDFDEYQLYIYEKTLLNTLTGIFDNKQLYTGVERLNRISNNLDHRLDGIEQQIANNQPKFVFAHFLLPHEPAVFSNTCQPLTFDEARKRSKIEGYLDQLQCVNQIMQDLSTKIITNTNRPVVIIFQSDEGPYLPGEYFGTDKEQIPDSQDARLIHSSILNTVYLSQKDNPNEPIDYPDVGFYDGISPINTWRLILNYYFNSNLPRLEDKTYIFSNSDHPYNFIDITDQLYN